ncbi:MAG: hypothetical protein M3P83_05670 [Actinomycetota bacterium]|nr:hypothetical protein [Actinomycetota bacterium]
MRPKLRSFGALVDLIHELRRQAFLRSLPEPRKRSREEILATMQPGGWWRPGRC